jgi:hypothetical protein
VSVNDSKRILALQRAGLPREAVAAIFDLELDELHAITTDPENNHLPAFGGGGAPAPAFIAHNWTANGDTGGIFYALGTNESADAFSNPAVAGRVVATESGIFTPWDPPPHATYLTDRDSTVNIFHSSAAGDHWARWDFGTARSVSLREYTVRSRWDSNQVAGGGPGHPTAWQLQGSNDGSTWDVIDVVAAAGFTALDQWKHFTCDNPDLGPYRYIRLLDSADTYLILGEVELYGDLYTS